MIKASLKRKLKLKLLKGRIGGKRLVHPDGTEFVARNATKRAHGKVGTPAFAPSSEQRQIVSLLTALGTPQEIICQYVRWPDNSGKDSGKAIERHALAKHFAEEIEFGMANANMKVSESLYTKAVGRPPEFGMKKRFKKIGRRFVEIEERVCLHPGVPPDLGAIVWWEKTRRGYKEGIKVEHSNPDGSPMAGPTINQSVMVVLPRNGRELPGTTIHPADRLLEHSPASDAKN